MKAIVIGAGLLGVSTAHYLRRQGVDVVVIESNDGPGLETSFANGGMIHASQASPWNEPGVLRQVLRTVGREDSALLIRLNALPHMLGWTFGFFRNATQETYLKNSGKNARLAQYSIRAFRELTNELNFSFDRADQGTLKIYRDKTGLSDAVTVARRCAQWDIPFTVLDSKAVAELEPSLAPISHQLTGGIHFPEDISGDAHRFCAELAAVTDELGATFHYGTRVNEILKSHHSFRGIRLASGEEIEADACVVATGVGTPQILKPLGIRVPIEPVKGYSITVDIENWHPRPQRPIIDEHYHAAVCPLGQRLRVAGTAEFAGFDTQMRPARIQNLHHLIGELYPQAPNDTGTDNAWTGLRPMTPDGVGIMGESGLKGLYLNTGHGHLGWTMATGAGRALSELITERESRFDLADFSVERFTG